MYKSPIEIINKIAEKASKALDDKVESAIQSYEATYDVAINRDELLKALKYDRRQYDKGYNDGYEDGYAKAIEDVSELLAEELGYEPCEYNDNVAYMRNCEKNWCEEHCGNCELSDCWEKFITEKLKELRGE